MRSPYEGLDRRAYWRSGVAEGHPLAPADLYRPKFAIRREDRILTAGSCFAQHIAGRLRQHGFDVLDAEPPPEQMTPETARRFGFLLYSARYGNVYTVRQMLQLLQEAEGARTPAEVVWTRDGRCFDALRPSVEPEGLGSAEAVLEHRALHLARLRWLLANVTLFVFTLGLTEAWRHRGDGTVHPTAPGTIADPADPARHEFHNFTYPEILEDFLALRALVRRHNEGVRFLLTVSPVPLTATATADHVLCASTHSKAVLRAVAGELAATCPDIDYFPSYEMVAGHPSRGIFYESNLRTVSPAGVDVVMRCFLEQHGMREAPPQAAGRPAAPRKPRLRPDGAEALAGQAAGRAYCDEEILEQFS